MVNGEYEYVTSIHGPLQPVVTNLVVDSKIPHLYTCNTTILCGFFPLSRVLGIADQRHQRFICEISGKNLLALPTLTFNLCPIVCSFSNLPC